MKENKDKNLDNEYKNFKLIEIEMKNKGEGEIIKIEEEEESGIIRKELKILIVNGEKPEENGSNYPEMKALIENGTERKAIWENGCWMRSDGHTVLDPSGESVWDSSLLCYGKNAGSVRSFCIDSSNFNLIQDLSADADVIVVVNSNDLGEKVLGSEVISAMVNCRSVISYGNRNAKFDEIYKDQKNFTHLNSEDGCKNLLNQIQSKFSKSKFSKIKFEGYGYTGNIQGKFVGTPKYKLEGKMDREVKRRRQQIGLGLLGLGALEELIGQFGFGKSILGKAFGYNSNSKGKNVEDVKDNKDERDNKDAKKEKNKEVNNSGNQVK